MNFLVMGSGAREHIIGEKLSQAGATVFSIGVNPNGLNINNNCALHKLHIFYLVL